MASQYINRYLVGQNKKSQEHPQINKLLNALKKNIIIQLVDNFWCFLQKLNL